MTSQEISETIEIIEVPKLIEVLEEIRETQKSLKSQKSWRPLSFGFDHAHSISSCLTDPMNLQKFENKIEQT